MAIIGRFTDDGLQQTINAANIQGYKILPTSFRVSATADPGPIDTARTLGDLNPQWFTANITGFNNTAFDTLEVIATIPPGANGGVPIDVAEIYLLAANTALEEKFTIDTVADVAGSLDGTFILMQDKNGSVAFWFDVDNSGTLIPAGASAATRAVEVTQVTTGMTADQVAKELAEDIAADAEFSASFQTNQITVTDNSTGARIDSADGDAGFTFTIVTQGADQVEFLLTIAQPDVQLTYDPSGSLIMRLILQLTNVDLTANFEFLFTQAQEIATHNTDPNAHPQLQNAMNKHGIFVNSVESRFLGQSNDAFALFSGGTKEQTLITAVADVAGSLDGKYFLLQDRNGSVAFWIDVDNGGTTIPAGASAAARAIEITTIALNDTSSEIAAKLITAIGLDGEFDTSANGTTQARVTQVIAGIRVDAVDGDTGFTLTTDVQGVDGTVFDRNIVYLDGGDNNYKQAIADGSNASIAMGILDLENEVVGTIGIWDITHGFANNIDVYLSSSVAGAITSTKTAVRIGRTIGANKILLDITNGQLEIDILSASSQRRFTIPSIQAVAADITGLIFDKTVVRSFEANVSMERRDDTISGAESGKIRGLYNSETDVWEMTFMLSFDTDFGTTGFDFLIVALTGQVQFIASDFAGANYAGELQYSNITKTFI